MTNEQNTTQKEHHHHHHRHHRMDSASKFKQRSLAIIELKKIISKVLKIFLIVLSVLLAVAVFISYKFL